MMNEKERPPGGGANHEGPNSEEQPSIALYPGGVVFGSLIQARANNPRIVDAFAEGMDRLARQRLCPYRSVELSMILEALGAGEMNGGHVPERSLPEGARLFVSADLIALAAAGVPGRGWRQEVITHSDRAYDTGSARTWRAALICAALDYAEGGLD
ncbi:MAG: hypothetical protein ACYC99_14940 [Candidatus Geothermincolia bacterium]